MNDWKTRFREIIYKYNRNTDDPMSFVDVTLMRDLEQFIQLTIEEEVKKTAEDICLLIDQIELQSSSTLEEWKEYKHIRNTIRDKYVLKEGK